MLACGDDAQPLDPELAMRVPCAVAGVLERHCTECHGDPLREGAPIPLLGATDFARKRGSGTVADLAAARIRDELRPMPPSGLLRGRDFDVLSNWLARGAPGEAKSCDVDTTPRDAGMPRDAGAHLPRNPRAVERTDWPTYGGDLANTRANLDDHAIGVGNVGSLVHAWELPTASTSSSPLVIDGVAYVPTWGAELHAVDVLSGEERWKVKLPALVDSSAGAGGDQLFISDSKGSVHGLRRADGALLWSQKLDEHPNVHLWSTPVYVPGEELVVVGTSSYEEVTGASPLTFRGSLVALDARDGHERWRFQTSQDDDGTGVAIWSTAAVDLQRKRIYIGTGNNYAPPGSELSDSLLAIDYVTGNLVWSHQFLADDVFSIVFAPGPDYDIGSPAVLFSAGGRDLVGVGIKSGLFAALDRDDGNLVWTKQVAPGGYFGGIISPPAYADGVLYVLSNDETTNEVVLAALDATSSELLWQHRLPGQAFGGVAYANGLVYAGNMHGTLIAFDAKSGEEKAKEDLPNAVASPVIASGTLIVPWGYSVSLGDQATGEGGIIGFAPSE